MPPPRFISCQLCGQQFGSSSIGIHVPQCHDKMYKRWQNLDPKTRGPPPPMPHGLRSGGMGGSGSGMRSSSSSASAYGNSSGNNFALGLMNSNGRNLNKLGGGAGMGTMMHPKAQVPLIHQTQYQFGQEYETVSTNKCRKCGRGFSYDRLAYHESVCLGPSNKGGKKRKTFNSKNQRLGDFDKFEIGSGGGGGGSYASGKDKYGSRGGLSPPQNRTNWRQQHHEFITAIREAKRYAPPPHQNNQTRYGAQPSNGYGRGAAGGFRGGSGSIRGGGGGGGGFSSAPSAQQQQQQRRAPFQGSLERNPIVSRHTFNQQNIAAHSAMGNNSLRSRSSAGGGGATSSSAYGGGGGGGGRAFGNSTGRWGGNSSGGGGGFGGGGGAARIATSNETSLGMLQAFGRV